MPTPADIHTLVTTTDRPIADIAADLGLSVDALEKRLERHCGKRSRQLRTGSAAPQVGRGPSGRTTWQVRLTAAERAVVDAALVAGRAAGAKSDGEALAKALQRLTVAPPITTPAEAVPEPETSAPPAPPLRRKHRAYRPKHRLPGDGASEAAQKERFKQTRRRFVRQAPTSVAPTLREALATKLSLEADEVKPAPVEAPPAAAVPIPIPAGPPDWALDEMRGYLGIADPDTHVRIAARGGYSDRIGKPEVVKILAAAEVWLRANGAVPVALPAAVTEWQKARHDITGASATDDAWGDWTVTTRALVDLLRGAVLLIDTPWWAYVLSTIARPECPAHWRAEVERFDARLRRGGIALTPPAKGSDADIAARFVREFGT